jgi:hypothetical protein
MREAPISTGSVSDLVCPHTSFNLSGASRAYLGAQASRLQ